MGSTTNEVEGTPDLILYGAPISRSSISVSGASLYPTEFRRMWKGFATYNLDEKVDLKPFQVVDAGEEIFNPALALAKVIDWKEATKIH